MKIRQQLRPTLMRTNSRHRGPSELNKYSNFILETVHDLKKLGSFMDRNEFIPGHRGHVDFIAENFGGYLNGEGELKATIPTATTVGHPTGDVFDDLDLMNYEWTAYGGCSKSSSWQGVVLSSTGMLDPSGIQAQIYGEEGAIIFMRMGVRVLSGDITGFAIGSYNLNQGEGDLSRYKIPKNGSIIYVDKRLYCKHREPVSLNIDVHNVPDQLNAASVELVDVSIQYFSENALAVEPVNSVVKSRINKLEDEIDNIIRNL